MSSHVSLNNQKYVIKKRIQNIEMEISREGNRPYIWQPPSSVRFRDIKIAIYHHICWFRDFHMSKCSALTGGYHIVLSMVINGYHNVLSMWAVNSLYVDRICEEVFLLKKGHPKKSWEIRLFCNELKIS